MTSQMNTKFRWVRCPRCKNVLPEFAEVPVYECGGCGAILQAKNRKKDTKESHLHKADPPHKNGMEHVSEEKEARSLNKQATIPSTEESALDKSSVRDQNEIRDCKREQLGSVNHSDELPGSTVEFPGSTELTSHENAKSSSPHARAHMEGNEDKCPSDQCDMRDQNEVGDYKRELPEDVNVSNEVASSTELNCHENESSSPGAEAQIEVDESNYSLEQNNGSNQNDLGDCTKESPGIIKFSMEVSSSIEQTCHEIEHSDGLRGSTELKCHENAESSPQARADMEAAEDKCPLDHCDRSDHNEFGDYNREHPGDVSFSSDVSSLTELNRHENETSSLGAGSHIEVDESNYSLQQNNGRDQNDFGDCSEELPGNIKFSMEDSSSTECTCHDIEHSGELPYSADELPGSTELTCHEIEHSSELPYSADELPGSTELTCHVIEHSDKLPCSTDELPGSADEQLPCSADELPGSNELTCHEIEHSDELPCSTELTFHEIEHSSELPYSADELPGYTELTCHEIEHSDELPCSTDELPGSADEQLPCSADELPGSNELTYHEIEHSDELRCSTELTCHENAESSQQARADMEADEDKFPFDHCNRRDQNEYEDYNRGQPGDMKFSDDVSSSTELKNKSSSPGAGAHIEVGESNYSLEQNDGRDHNAFGGCSEEPSGKLKFSMEVSSSTELTCQEIEDPSQVAGADTEVDENFKSRFIFRSSNADNLRDARPRDSITTAQCPLGESILSDNLMSPCMEQMTLSRNNIVQVFDRVSSVDTLKNMALVNTSSELCVTVGEMSKSPTRRYYAYDGSASSCNETDDQVPDRHFHLSKRNFKDTDRTKGFPRRNEFIVSNKMRSESEMQNQAMNSSSILPAKKHHATKGTKWHRDEFLAPTRHGNPVRSVMGLETDRHLSRPLFYPRASQAGHRNGSPSSYGHKEYECSSSYHSPDKPEYSEPDKMELLRLVSELQDQLNRANILNGNANGRLPATVAKKEKQNSLYYGHLAPEREIYPDLNYPRYTGRYNQGKSWSSQQGKISRMAFSGESPYCRHQVDCSCLHCCPQEWRCSAQLPPRVCYNKGHCMAHLSHNFCSPYHTGPSSPQHYMGSEFSLWSCDTKFDDQRHTDREMKKLYSREKPHPMKRHSRPIAGGAPIIACYRCLKLLQLPADFLLFGRKCHRLRCSACSRVLKFSLQNRTHIVPYIPYIPDTIAPPPSEVDDNIDAIKMSNLASAASHTYDYRHAEPVSCSDDYGQSLCKSYSTDGDPFSLTAPFHTLGRNSNDRKMSSGSSFEPLEDRKKKSVLKEFSNKYKNPMETFDSVGPSSKMSKQEKSYSEIQELPPGTVSPLHLLMGYASPSRVIRG